MVITIQFNAYVQKKASVNQINFIKPYMSVRILHKQLDNLKFQNVLRVSLYSNVTSMYWDIQ